MACYKVSETRPRPFVVDLERQLLSNTVKYALYGPIDRQPDLSRIDTHYDSDLNGPLTYPSALKLRH